MFRIDHFTALHWEDQQWDSGDETGLATRIDSHAFPKHRFTIKEKLSFVFSCMQFSDICDLFRTFAVQHQGFLVVVVVALLLPL